MAASLSRDHILNAALQLGNHVGWEKLTLYQIARHLDLSLADIHQHFAQKDDLVDAWLDRADTTMLAHFPQAVSDAQSTTEQRLRIAMQKWLDALSPHHKLTGDMLLYKLEPGHFHLQAAGVLRISRTVQWFREAAELNAGHLQRIGQEIALSSLFIGIFIHWLNDKTPNQRSTRERLRHALRCANRLHLWK